MLIAKLFCSRSCMLWLGKLFVPAAKNMCVWYYSISSYLLFQNSSLSEKNIFRTSNVPIFG